MWLSFARLSSRLICRGISTRVKRRKKIATMRKEAKYSNVPSQYTFHPIAIKTHGSLNETALDLLRELGRRITACSGDDREGFFLFRRLSVCLQWFNAVLPHDGFSMDQLY